jgi:hypothetical protein
MPHTPTPWMPDDSGHVRGADGRKITLALSGLALSCGVPSEQDKADGAFVLRAVNSHDALVAALKAMCDRFPYWFPHDSGYCDPAALALVTDARAALAAQAEQQP